MSTAQVHQIVSILKQNGLNTLKPILSQLLVCLLQLCKGREKRDEKLYSKSDFSSFLGAMCIVTKLLHKILIVVDVRNWLLLS